MQRTFKLGLGLISILSFVVLVAIWQATATTNSYFQEPMTPKAPQTVTISGKVSAVSDTSVTVVDDQKASQTVAIDAKTKISKAGKSAKAGDIKADDAVVIVAVKGEGDALTAVSIKVS